MYNASKPTLSATVDDTMSYTPGAWQNARARTRSAKAARRSAVLTTSSLALLGRSVPDDGVGVLGLGGLPLAVLHDLMGFH